MTYLILFLSVVGSAAIARLFRVEDRHKIRLLTAFGGAYVFTITILHLLPEVYEGGNKETGWFILLGFFVQIGLEYFSHGIEHGHAHQKEQHGVIPIGVLLGLCIHAYVEGMPLGEGHLHAHADAESEHSDRMLLAGIVMHNVPVSVVLLSMLLHNRLPERKIWFLIVTFALMSPLGALTSHFSQALVAYHTQLTGIVIGIFLHLSTTILFEASEAHRFNRQKIIGILLGAIVAILSVTIH